MRKKSVPIVRPGLRIPGPIRFFGVFEDDACVRKAVVGIAPHIPVAGIRCRPASPCALEPGMLIRAVVDDELRDYAQLSSLGLAHEGAKMLHRAEVWIDVLV